LEELLRFHDRLYRLPVKFQEVRMGGVRLEQRVYVGNPKCFLNFIENRSNVLSCFVLANEQRLALFQRHGNHQNFQ
jgi:hypothetical protein